MLLAADWSTRFQAGDYSFKEQHDTSYYKVRRVWYVTGSYGDFVMLIPLPPSFDGSLIVSEGRHDGFVRLIPSLPSLDVSLMVFQDRHIYIYADEIQ